jgi:hypothetical protein
MLLKLQAVDASCEVPAFSPRCGVILPLRSHAQRGDKDIVSSCVRMKRRQSRVVSMDIQIAASREVSDSEPAAKAQESAQRSTHRSEKINGLVDA